MSKGIPNKKAGCKYNRPDATYSTKTNIDNSVNTQKKFDINHGQVSKLQKRFIAHPKRSWLSDYPLLLQYCSFLYYKLIPRLDKTIASVVVFGH